MNRLFCWVRHMLAVVIFGLVIPTTLFLNAYPGGVNDMVNRIKFEHMINQYTKTIQINLPHNFSFETLSYYAIAASQLETADEHTKIMITVNENMGGMEAILASIEDSIKKSKALVMITINRFGFSCGTYILMSGDYVIIPNNALLLFHTGYMVRNGVPERICPNPFDDEMNKAYDITMIMFKPFTGWLTDPDKKRYFAAEDVFVAGEEVCKLESAHVLFTYRDGCVIAGTKGTK